MRIVIDMQGAQTESRFRGIGRYSLAFAQAVVRNRGEHEVVLALNGMFPDTIEPIRTAFDGMLPQGNIRVWYAPGPVKAVLLDNDARRRTAELIREAFLASLQPDVIHITSLFEGYVDDAVTNIGQFDCTTPVSVSLYDLIPLLNPDQYLIPNRGYAAFYSRKVETLQQATMMLAISEHSRQEGLQFLGASAERIVSIGAAICEEFQPIVVNLAQSTALFESIGVTRAVVLYAGGADERKNLPRLLEAWSALPTALRQTHQLFLVGKMPDGHVAELRQTANAHGLQNDKLLFSGYVSDEELVQLYNLCKLSVLPSWHEGFGLPALEAMACGAPLIGANTTSLPEVIGLEDALFDPFDVMAISSKIAEALQNEDFRAKLRQHGLRQAQLFSWDSTAKKAVTIWEQQSAESLPKRKIAPPVLRKPRLAFVSPLPPERTGIADYSAGLLPALAAYYDIELVVAQKKVDGPWGEGAFKVRDEAWLRKNFQAIDRVLYQMGNSPFHQHMLSLIEEIPGTVVLHDFYMSGLMEWLELSGADANAWTNALYSAHGYGAVQERQRDAKEAKRKYPANLRILQYAQGVIVHSEYSRSLAQHWYGSQMAKDWTVIPLLRSPTGSIERSAARKQLDINENDFLICSFGFLDSTKLNHRLLQSWLESELATDTRCRLVFVGENHGGEYGASMLKTISESSFSDRIHITGFASSELFHLYLVAADLAVQLRTQSRGETSAAALDCMNYGLPLIVNSNGSMAEIDPQAVCILPDEFSNAALVDKLEALWREPERRRSLGERSSEIIHSIHSPQSCASQYADAIEHFHLSSATSMPALLRAIAENNNFTVDAPELARISSDLGANLPLLQPSKRIFLDVTATCLNDLKTGIERVARALILALLESPPEGYRVEPVYLSNADGEWHHRYARSYTLRLLNCPEGALLDEPIDPENGDVLITLDLSGSMLLNADQAGLFRNYRELGTTVHAVVYDLLPVLMPSVFPPGTDISHNQWLQAVSKFDGALCISKAVADELMSWRRSNGITPVDRRPYHVGWFHLGADVSNSAPSRGVPAAAAQVVNQVSARFSFLMVGTIEPRKGHLQVIEAFQHLWNQGLDVNLIIVGSEGWKDLPKDMRRNIPSIIESLRTHPELGNRILWLEKISDEYLEIIYQNCDCLIAASYGEGFGLPLIEAGRHNLAIIARDIPVFREVAGPNTSFFTGNDPEQLAQGLVSMFGTGTKLQKEKDRHAPTDWMTSSRDFIRTAIEGDWYRQEVAPSISDKVPSTNI
jgi:glycosyltransferase involved in cell wall biosynthesis